VTGTDITTLPAELWEKTLANGSLGIPDAAANRIRIFQSFYPLAD